jgi:molecular chaperone GrpE (heat shock protein)
MNNQNEPKLSKAPFFIGDAALIGLGGFVCWQAKLPLGPWEIAFAVVCGVVGAGLSVAPYMLEYQGLLRRDETACLASTVEQIQELQSLAAQISAATARWQIVQEQSDKTVGAARGVAERMATEAAAFTEFLQKANDGERTNLRLEVEKLRRTESDWLQAIVRMLDHIYALNQAALRSGQPSLIEQLGNFQSACRDVARRVGLVPVVPAAKDPFNAQLHQLAEGNNEPQSDARIDQTIATGFTFQGRLVRPALVTLRGEASSNGSVHPKTTEGTEPNGKSEADSIQERLRV